MPAPKFVFFLKLWIVILKINNNYIPRMRTITQAYKAIKESDPNTAFTMRALRRMVDNNEIPSVSIGNKKLINLDLLLSRLACYNDDDIRVSLMKEGTN